MARTDRPLQPEGMPFGHGLLPLTDQTMTAFTSMTFAFTFQGTWEVQSCDSFSKNQMHLSNTQLFAKQQ